MRRLIDKSRMSGDVHVRFCESLRGQFPWATRLIVTAETPEILEERVKPAVKAFLQARGLSLAPQKTHITHIDTGFKFLRFNIRKYKGKLLIKPDKSSVKSVLDKVREIIKSNPTAKTENLIRQLTRLSGAGQIISVMLFPRKFFRM